MKKLIFIALVLTTSLAKAQNNLDVLPMQNNKVVFYRSDFLDATKAVMFARARYWMAGNTALGMAIQTADTTTGVIRGTGHFVMKLKDGDYAAMDNRFDFRIQVTCADDQYSFTMDNFTFTQLGTDGKPINGNIPLETMAATSKANANAINTQFQKIYFSFIDAITNTSAYSNTVINYTPPSQLYLDLIKKTTISSDNSIYYDTPHKEIIQLDKYFSNNNSASITATLLILRPVAEATNQPVLLTFEDGSQNTITSKSYWTKKSDQYLYKFTFDPDAQQMELLKQKKIQKMQMAETTINIDDLLASKVKAWANYLNNLTDPGVSASAAQQSQLGALPEVDGKVAYESTVNIPNKTQDVIFTVANKWILDNYNSQHNINQNGVILSADKDQGQILAKAAFRFTEEGNFLHPGYSWMYIFNIQIDCKDNKYRIRLYNMFYGTGFNDKNPIDMEYYNDNIKTSKAAIVHQNTANLDAQFKGVMQSLADAVNKAVKDEF